MKFVERPKFAKDLAFSGDPNEMGLDPNENINNETVRTSMYYSDGASISTLCKYLEEEYRNSKSTH
jgi:hypothetical protein